MLVVVVVTPFSHSYQIEYGCVEAKGPNGDGSQEYLDGFAPQRGEVEKGRQVVLDFVLLLVFVFDLSLL